MMRIFIADDEDIIRDGIRNCIEKEQGKFLFAGEAPDGEMALPMMMEIKPDVLITDIRMPFMDGLELARVVRRTMPWMRIVFLSGHDEFEYAQKAVSLHADAYLLKPVDSAQLLATLADVAARIEEEQQQYRQAEFEYAQKAVSLHADAYLLKPVDSAQLLATLADVAARIEEEQQQYRQAVRQSRSEQEDDALREHFFNLLLSGGMAAADAVEQGAPWGLSPAVRQYLVCILRLPDNRDAFMQARALSARTFDGQQEVICFFRGSTRMVLLLQGESEDAVRERAYEVCQNLRHEIRQFLGWDTLAAIGLPVTRLSALPDSYRTAKETMLRAAACAEGGVFGSTDFASGKTGFDFSAGGALADQLRHAAPEDVPRIVDEYFGNAAEEDMKSVLYRYYLLMDLLVSAAADGAAASGGKRGCGTRTRL